MTRISCAGSMIWMVFAMSACSNEKFQRVSLNDLLQNKQQFVGDRVVIEGCIFWGRHGAGILSCDGNGGGMGILDPEQKLLEAFGSVGALPYGGEISGKVYGIVVVDDAYRPAELDSPDTHSRTYLRVEKIVGPQKARRRN